MDSGKDMMLAGLLVLAGMLAGIFSVAPAIDSAQYLTEAARHSAEVILAAVFQLVLSFTGMGAAVVLYSCIGKPGNNLARGFLCFRVIAASLSLGGTVLLLALLALSRRYQQSPSQQVFLASLGNVLRTARDQVNHVFMILVLCSGNLMFYVLLSRLRTAPRWLSLWGLAGSILAMIASCLVLFGKIAIITGGYLALNAPAAILEIVLGIWLIVKGRAMAAKKAARNRVRHTKPF